ncbi:MAG: hypothetical protein J5673_02425 [Candidatus Methanomethylophilaceae archaeon]|nr:hypothetical protein [Candidatus Methanomethylophilaceae archaeon]
MNDLSVKLQRIREKKDRTRIMIMGLGSVGNYLMDYLMSSGMEDIEIIVAGRNHDKMEQDVNIVRIASLIRGQNRTKISIESNVDLNVVSSIADCIRKNQPDIIVNSSRAYPGLKYGSISWKNVRAYGIWTPLSIKFVKNIMEAVDDAKSDAIVINTSYSDAVIPWLKSAGRSYPDFGSGNINHLIPRIKYAIAEIKGIRDYWNIDITYAVSHFHDVVISKEGQTEGVKQLIVAKYDGKKIDVDYDAVFSRCSISMPTDAKRNMMNASSNYEIIKGILDSAKNGKKVKLHIPGAFGNLGGYPVILDGSKDKVAAYFDESEFSLDEMKKKNAESIYLDGVEKVEDGILTYTDELIAKANKAFGVELPKNVAFKDIDKTAQFIIDEIIMKNVEN